MLFMLNNALEKIALGLLPGIGDVLAKKLLSYCGTAEEVFKIKKSRLLKIPGIGTKLADAITSQGVFKRAEKELRFIEKENIQMFFFGDEDYPKRLRHCPDGPLLLYFKGQADFNQQKIIAVVGTRKATDYGKSICTELMEGLKAYSPLVVSGLAYGIDIHIHKESLKQDISNIGVLAHGLDIIYPPAHRTIALKMQGCGGILTEFMTQTQPGRENFPRRNRIIAGLADAVVVVEARILGGALITADIACSYNRDVFAFPGRSSDVFSAGCNELIKSNKAQLITSVNDLVYYLGWENKKIENRVQRTLMFDCTEEEKIILEVLREKNLGIDDLQFKSKLPVSKASAALLNLEMNGVVRMLPGKVYELV